MKNALSLSISMITLGLAASMPTFAADEADSLTAAIAGGDATLALRYRFEYVDDTTNREALASTLKTRITYKTLPYNSVSATLEMDNNSVIGDDKYSDSKGDADEEAIVADPKYTEINQAYVDITALEDTVIRYGRQRVLLDNQRFVGGVGWRQNEQTYDAFAIVNTSLPDTTITLANIHNINNIFGANANGNDHQVYHINNKSIDGLNLSGYYYDLKDITNTYGIRANGKFAASDDLSILYTVELAQQERDTAASDEVETDYMNLEAGASFAGFTAKLGYEVLGSDDVDGDGVADGAFYSALGTNHAFNGWADKFLNTSVPALNNGLVDKSITLSTKKLGPKVAIKYHNFDAENGNGQYGSEVDLLIAQKFDKNYTGVIKAAHYSDADFSQDTTKIWLQLAAKF